MSTDDDFTETFINALAGALAEVDLDLWPKHAGGPLAVVETWRGGRDAYDGRKVLTSDKVLVVRLSDDTEVHLGIKVHRRG